MSRNDDRGLLMCWQLVVVKMVNYMPIVRNTPVEVVKKSSSGPSLLLYLLT